MFLRRLHYSSIFFETCLFAFMLRRISALNSLKYLLLPCRLADDIPRRRSEKLSINYPAPGARGNKTVITPHPFKHLGYSGVVINRYYAPDLHAGAQEQTHAAEGGGGGFLSLRCVDRCFISLSN